MFGCHQSVFICVHLWLYSLRMKIIGVIEADLERTGIGTRSRLADEIAGEPVLRRTVKRAREAQRLSRLHVVARADQRATVERLVSDLGASSPYLLLTALFFVTAALGMVLSNSATAVLVAPIAIGAAEAMNVSPYAFAMTVAIAASAAYITPVASPAVTLVVDPGKYRVIDFVKLGVPMLILTWLVTIFLAPLLFPF